MTEEEMIKGYKGFKEGLVCLDKQYAENTVFIEESAELCKSGMHFCENPLCVLEYYPYYNGTDFSEYATVEAVAEKTMPDDTKSVTKELHIGKKICFEELIDCGISYIIHHANDVNTTTGDRSASVNTGDRSASTNSGNYSASTNTGYCSASTNTGYCSASVNTGDRSASTNTGNYSASTNTGDFSASTNTGNYSASTNTGNCSASTNTGNYSASTNTGYCSASTNTGYCSASVNTGDRSASTNTGNYSASVNTGNYSASTNTGYCSASVNTGDYSASTNTGDRSASTNTGDYSASTNTGNYSASLVTGNYSKASTEKNSISIALGIESYAKSGIGGYIVLTECAVDEIGNKIKIVDCKCFKVDGNIIKADTYYTLCNGIAKEMVEETAE